MVKNLLLLLVLLLVLTSCNRMRVKHNHDVQVPTMHMPVDTAQKDYTDELEKVEMIGDKEGLMVVPDEQPSISSPPGNVDMEIERMMRGEDLSGE